MLEIKERKLFYLGEPIDTSNINLEDFLMANLSQPIKISEDETFENIMHVLFDAKKFINAYFSEEYAAINAMVTMGKLAFPVKHIRVYKTIEFEQDSGMIYLTPKIQLITPKEGEKIVPRVADLTFELDKSLEDSDDILNRGIVKKPKTEIFLIDFLSIIFDDLSHALKHENLLK